MRAVDNLGMVDRVEGKLTPGNIQVVNEIRQNLSVKVCL